MKQVLSLLSLISLPFKCLDCSEKKLDFRTGIYVAFVQVQIAVFMKRCVSFVNLFKLNIVAE